VTAVVAHGANPGLVSHFVKRGLQRLAIRRGIDSGLPFAAIAKALDIRTIHIAERDTQDDGLPLGADEFANTWSVDGLMAEAQQPAELGWGTHEKDLPPGGKRHGEGSQAGIFLDACGATVRVKSWVPSSGAQRAYLITHHEALSIGDFLSLRDEDGSLVYRPTVFYAYRPSAKTCASLDAWVRSGFKPRAAKTLMRDAIRTGQDELGVLFVFEGGVYWYGSTLTNAQARTLAPCNNATSLQVNASIVAALQWMLKHPHEGVTEAEYMDHDEVLSAAAPYLGTVHEAMSDWQPAPGSKLSIADFLDIGTR
jgi:homospermidine synthase